MRLFSKTAFDDIVSHELQRGQNQDETDGLHMKGMILSWPDTLCQSKYVQERGLQEV